MHGGEWLGLLCAVQCDVCSLFYLASSQIEHIQAYRPMGYVPHTHSHMDHSLFYPSMHVPRSHSRLSMCTTTHCTPRLCACALHPLYTRTHAWSRTRYIRAQAHAGRCTHARATQDGTCLSKWMHGQHAEHRMVGCLYIKDWSGLIGLALLGPDRPH